MVCSNTIVLLGDREIRRKMSDQRMGDSTEPALQGREANSDQGGLTYVGGAWSGEPRSEGKRGRRAPKGPRSPEGPTVNRGAPLNTPKENVSLRKKGDDEGRRGTGMLLQPPNEHQSWKSGPA